MRKAICLAQRYIGAKSKENIEEKSTKASANSVVDLGNRGERQQAVGAVPQPLQTRRVLATLGNGY